jgi:hypothetical protein
MPSIQQNQSKTQKRKWAMVEFATGITMNSEGAKDDQAIFGKGKSKTAAKAHAAYLASLNAFHNTYSR